MFLGLPLGNPEALQKTALILSTVVLLSVLIISEVMFSEASEKKRYQVRYFYPLVFVVAGLVLYAIYRQVGA